MNVMTGEFGATNHQKSTKPGGFFLVLKGQKGFSEKVKPITNVTLFLTIFSNMLYAHGTLENIYQGEYVIHSSIITGLSTRYYLKSYKYKQISAPTHICTHRELTSDRCPLISSISSYLKSLLLTALLLVLDF